MWIIHASSNHVNNFLLLPARLVERPLALPRGHFVEAVQEFRTAATRLHFLLRRKQPCGFTLSLHQFNAHRVEQWIISHAEDHADKRTGRNC